MAQYGSDGKWIPNLINWLIGSIVMYIWSFLLFFLNLFMMYQVPMDGFIGVYESFAPEGVSDSYTSMMDIGNGGTSGTALI